MAAHSKKSNTTPLASPMKWPSSSPSSDTNTKFDIPEARSTELLKLFNRQAPISRTLGMTLSFDDNGDAVISCPYNAATAQAGSVCRY
jgi:hypothetical protein